MNEVKEGEFRIHRGLTGVYFDRSSLSDIDGRAGELYYRGYSIDHLAMHASFEETAWLLMRGELPNQDELSEFKKRLAQYQKLPDFIYSMIDALKKAHPMDVLRSCVSALGHQTSDNDDHSINAEIEKGEKMIAQVSMIITAHARIREGQNPIKPNPNLSHAGNFLYMLSGKKPDPEDANLLDKDLVLHAEHGSNASSFAARVVIGTRANLHAAITAAVAALSGPAHGGAAEDVMKMAREIKQVENVTKYIKEMRKNRIPVTGFGHRVYRAEDPRARHVKAGVEKLSQKHGDPKWFQILMAIREEMAPYARHGVHVNVDFYSGAMYHLLGIKEDLFVPVFALGRVPGWVAQCIEQRQSNILIRPLTVYDGPPPRKWVPIDERE